MLRAIGMVSAAALAFSGCTTLVVPAPLPEAMRDWCWEHSDEMWEAAYDLGEVITFTPPPATASPTFPVELGDAATIRDYDRVCREAYARANSSPTGDPS
jgi:hypothetical protein